MALLLLLKSIRARKYEAFANNAQENSNKAAEIAQDLLVLYFFSLIFFLLYFVGVFIYYSIWESSNRWRKKRIGYRRWLSRNSICGRCRCKLEICTKGSVVRPQCIFYGVFIVFVCMCAFSNGECIDAQYSLKDPILDKNFHSVRCSVNLSTR